ncbi:hypothetical protein ABPG72_010769 [Tetrahymena utriculariae]
MLSQKDCLQLLKVNEIEFKDIQDLSNHFLSNQNYSSLRIFEQEVQQIKLVGRNKQRNSDVVLIIANKSIQFKQVKMALSAWNMEINNFTVAEFDKNLYFRNIDLSQFSIEQIQNQQIEYPELVEKYSLQRKQQESSQQIAIIIRNHIAKFKNLQQLTIIQSQSIITKDQFKKLIEPVQTFSHLQSLKLFMEKCLLDNLNPLANSILQLNRIQELQLFLKGNNLTGGSYQKLCEAISQNKTLIELYIDTDFINNYYNQQLNYVHFEQILSNQSLKNINIQLGYNIQIIQTKQIIDQIKIYKLKCQTVKIKNIFKDLLNSQEFQNYSKLIFNIDCDYQSQDLIQLLSLYKWQENLKELELKLVKLNILEQNQLLEQINRFKNIYSLKLGLPFRDQINIDNHAKTLFECIVKLQKLRVLNIYNYPFEIKKKLFCKILKIKRLVKCTFY